MCGLDGSDGSDVAVVAAVTIITTLVDQCMSLGLVFVLALSGQHSDLSLSQTSVLVGNESGDGEESDGPVRPPSQPITRRIIITAVSVVSWMASWIIIENIDGDTRLSQAVEIFGLLILAGGLFLLCATAHTWSWGWWL